MYLPESDHIKYDLLSIDISSKTDLSWLGGTKEKLFPIRPADSFIETWPQTLSNKQNKLNYPLGCS